MDGESLQIRWLDHKLISIGIKIAHIMTHTTSPEDTFDIAHEGRKAAELRARLATLLDLALEAAEDHVE